MQAVRIAETPTYGRELIGRRIKEHAATRGGQLKLLEAGCGRQWNIDLDGVDVHLTGIDLDAEALAYRRDTVGDLDVAVVGDLRTVELAEEEYDVVFSAYVLEHIAGAEKVLDRLVAALRPGGLLVLRTPDGDAVYAWLARLLPFWTHVVYKRIVDHDPLAGKPGHPPYPVVYDDLVTRSGFHDYFARHGMTVIDEVGTNPHLDFAPMGLGRIGWVGQRAIATASRHRLAGTHSNLQLIVQKPSA